MEPYPSMEKVREIDSKEQKCLLRMLDTKKEIIILSNNLEKDVRTKTLKDKINLITPDYSGNEKDENGKKIDFRDVR